MNEKITFQQLAEHLSSLTGGSQATTETFIRELFAVVSEALSRGENVKIKNIGTFSPSGLADQPVLFAPDRELAEAINMPFACFEAVELNDDVTEDMLNEVSEEVKHDIEVEQLPEAITDENIEFECDKQDIAHETRQESTQEIFMVETESEEQEQEQDQELAPNPEVNDTFTADSTEDSANSDILVEQRESESNISEESLENDDSDGLCILEDEDESHSKRSFLWLAIVASLALGVVAGYVLGNIYPYQSSPMQETIAEQSQDMPVEDIESIVIDTAATDTTVHEIEPQAEPVEEQVLVTDTIRTTRFLTTMARQYYGEMIFWVYIYEANKEKLGNPNRIKPGTVVVIPDAKKYGIDRNDSVCVANAKLKAIEIYAPYQK